MESLPINASSNLRRPKATTLSIRLGASALTKWKLPLLGLGITCLIVAAINPPILSYLIRKKLDKVQKDWRTLTTRIANYGVDRCGGVFPPDTSFRRRNDPSAPLTFEWSPEMTKANHDAMPWLEPLTTPVAYIPSLPHDPFRRGSYYGYMCWNHMDHVPGTFVLFSPGPDGNYSLMPEKLHDYLERILRGRASRGSLDWEDRLLIWAIIVPHLYDPTNGVVSPGDLISISDAGFESLGWKRPFWTGFVLHRYGQIDPAGASKLTEEIYPFLVHPPLEEEWPEIIRRRQPIPVPVPSFDFLDFNNSAPPLPFENVQDHLGRHYESFVSHPHPLGEKELQDMKIWKNEAYRWWTNMQFRPPAPPASKEKALESANQIRYLPQEVAYSLYLPLYGKSQLLLGAESAAIGQSDKAFERIAFLRAWLEFLDSYVPQPHDPQQQRVHSELGRMCDELEASIKQPTQPASALSK